MKKKNFFHRQIHQTTAGTKLQLDDGYSASIVPLLPVIHSGQPVPPPSLLPSTSVFIFCLPTPTWTNTHIHSNTNTSGKLRIWARTLSCMPAGCCLHSHMTLKPGLRRRGINMNQTSCSQRPLSGAPAALVHRLLSAQSCGHGVALTLPLSSNWQALTGLTASWQFPSEFTPVVVHSILFQKDLIDLFYSTLQALQRRCKFICTCLFLQQECRLCTLSSCLLQERDPEPVS